ncbi:hypothetical protein VL05_12115 [Bacillus stratosphericus]|uniref:hypothetical protein n=1 Tax=Bacillus altitudinis TaxID=293387 RepID=UPI00064EECCB|nr:hypothetical protein [Bacillus altitudinis]KML01266.1 hypothetical protein VL05_12115 [Bacillus stratosphericus]KML48905.1 hypothetical protein VL17_16345 [Bacillus stratosphericus]WBL53241.1 hypothetical protein LOS13_08945 [Bacillus altitudinis]
MKHLFISDPKEFEHVLSFVHSLIHSTKTFPDQVLKTKPPHYLFEEFHWLLSDDSWEMLKGLALNHHDDYILMAVLDEQQSMDHYYHDFGYYPWVKIPLNLTPSDYLDLLTGYPIESVNDSIMDIASRVIWVSPSAKWIIYGERGYEIGVLAIHQLEQMNKQLLKTWRTLDEIVLDWISVVFPNQKLPDDFKKELIRNYTNVE